MDLIDFFEQQAQDNARFRLDALAQLRKRAHELSLLLLGGAGALGAFGLGRLGEVGIAAPFLAASAWGFSVAALVVWHCLRSRAVWPPHNEPKNLREAWGECLKGMGGDDSAAYVLLRERELSRLQDAIDSISEANAHVAKWLNAGFLCAAAMPLAAAVGWVTGLLSGA